MILKILMAILFFTVFTFLILGYMELGRYWRHTTRVIKDQRFRRYGVK